MTLFALQDVQPVAISIVGKGANRKRWYLRKDDEDRDDLIDLGPTRIVKAQDWSTVWCVVAEPGAVESAGQGMGSDDEDVWASEEEIIKACHAFAKSGGLINKAHESLEPYGQMVENFIAPTDFTVAGPDGEEQKIRKGSWCIAIEPSDEGRQAIDRGEFTGVSLQGTGHRIEKAHAGETRAGPISNLIRHYMKKPHPFTACVRDNRKRFGPRTEAICAGLKDLATGTHSWRKGGGKVTKADDADAFLAERVKAWTDAGLTEEDATLALEALREREKAEEGSGVKKLLATIAKKVGLSDDEIAEALPAGEVEKALPTFGTLIAQRELEDELPQAFSALREVTWRAFSPPPDDEDADPRATIETSLDEFKQWALDLLDRVSPLEKADRDLTLRKELGDPPEECATLPEDMGLTPEETQRLEKLEQAIAKIASPDDKGDGEKTEPTMDERLASIEERIEKMVPDEQRLASDIADVRKAEEERLERLDRMEQSIAKLAEGRSSQIAPTEQVKKSEEREYAEAILG